MHAEAVGSKDTHTCTLPCTSTLRPRTHREQRLVHGGCPLGSHLSSGAPPFLNDALSPGLGWLLSGTSRHCAPGADVGTPLGSHSMSSRGDVPPLPARA